MTETRGETDEILVRRFQKGDNQAYDAIVHRYQDRICRLAAIWLFDEQRSADVAQEVFLRGIKGLRSFRFRSAPFTWLYSTTKNICREQNRIRSTEPITFEQVDKVSSPSIDMDKAHAAREIRALITELPERQREVVLLRIFEELSVRETAKAMGCREGTVKALLHKAIKQLRSRNILARTDIDIC
ncbi:MAG: RNA polymerase sigma factor [Pseudomonadales bacterium]|nr:RNA polymerase sigma factor [Pseudomonadales bacterium]